MASRMRIGLVVAAVLAGLSGSMAARQQPPGRPSRSNFDIREQRAPAGASARARAELARVDAEQPRQSRLHPYTGGVRVLDAPGLSVPQGSSTDDFHRLLTQSADRLGLDDDDLASLAVARDYVSSTTGLRHVTFAQALDGLPVFGAVITMHIAQDGTVVRVTSSAARGDGRNRAMAVSADRAAAAAAADVSPGSGFVPNRLANPGDGRARFARGPFGRDVLASLEWFAMDGGARLAWHVELEPEPGQQFYDMLIDAASGELLLRRNRVLDADGSGRVMQSNATQAIDPRLPDEMPGVGACPPPLNHELRDLTIPFRDSSTVLFNAGRLSGNNVHVYRGAPGTEGALGTFDGSRWLFDDPFNSAASAETALFFALNFAHDFFYDLGFDEAAGNFQVDNLGRGGAAGDPVYGIARAAGRNNATFQTAPEGSSPIVSMFLWDGVGCWSQDVDGDGTQDIDGDYDTDIILHEFHHGVSHRLNVAFTGNEANAIGEGGSDFFAYSINGDTTLAEYARPGGLRAVNGKTYDDWLCLFGLFCSPHSNGEIWVNTLWDIRQRFRTDQVGGSESAAINESHQLYVDGLKLSPPAPTMLDMRDAMLLADSVRNPGSPRSQNFCALWESFAARGMGVNALDTADNGSSQVTAGYTVPSGCNSPPAPQTITIVASTNTATEAGLGQGAFTITRSEAASTALTVSLAVGGTALGGTDYQAIPTTATIPADAATIVVPVVPIDDTAFEANESVIVSLASGAGYLIGSPAAATVTIVSDDVAPDFTVTVLSAPANSGPGLTIEVSDTTRNQGAGPGAASTTFFYLSSNTLLDSSDTLLGTRDVPALAPGTDSTAITSLVLPSTVAAGTWRLIAKADGPGQIGESTEANNIRTFAIRIGPDLTISSVTAPANVGTGVAFAVSYTAANQGGTAIGPTTTRFYLSLNGSLGATDVPLQTHGLNQIEAGASEVGGATLTIPVDTPGGLYYIIAVADGFNLVPESSESNNVRYDTTRVGADLRVSALTVPVRASVGATISVTDTTINSGLSGAGSSRTTFYLSLNSSIAAGDIQLTPSRPIDPLAVNVASTGTTELTLPPAAVAGSWYLIASADDGREVAEATETNNIKYAAISIGPDLTVSSWTVPGTVVAGSAIVVSDTVKNIGEIAPPSATRFYLSLNTALDAGDILLEGQRDVPALGYNVVSTGPTTLTIPTGLSGRYYLIIVADGNSVVAEARENNNTRAVTMTINP
jgi:subtilase family serine protease